MKRRRPGISVAGFFQLCHPMPVAFHVLAVALFALLAAWPHILWGTFGIVVLAHTAMQLAIAVLNDYCDRHLDAASGRNKPIPRGRVAPRVALLFGLFWIVVMLLLLSQLNWLAGLLSLLYLAFGMAYNLGLKSTPFSGIVFALAIPLIPVYAFAGMNHLPMFIFWLVPVAALLGIALNLANSLSDVEEDATHAARTLAVVLGLRASMRLCVLLIFLAALLIALLAFSGMVPARAGFLAPTLFLTCLLLIVMLCLFRPDQSSNMRKGYFYVLVITCLVLAGGWLLSLLF